MQSRALRLFQQPILALLDKALFRWARKFVASTPRPAKLRPRIAHPLWLLLKPSLRKKEPPKSPPLKLPPVPLASVLPVLKLLAPSLPVLVLSVAFPAPHQPVMQ